MFSSGKLVAGWHGLEVSRGWREMCTATYRGYLTLNGHLAPE
jgi:hypothetical protein